MATKLGIVDAVGADPQQHGGLLSQAPLEGCWEIFKTADLPTRHTVGCGESKRIAPLRHGEELIKRSRRCRWDRQLTKDAATSVVDQQHHQWQHRSISQQPTVAVVLEG